LEGLKHLTEKREFIGLIAYEVIIRPNTPHHKEECASSSSVPVIVCGSVAIVDIMPEQLSHSFFIWKSIKVVPHMISPRPHTKLK
jgi:hypothetical protein